ncbi:fimbria/pilus outer membrane usher protein [Avibacterium paragallinarum]|uniref:fimbria/pilus outer membrane usher protein n=1 Tax=Avibacterium paragallinarum TaxID=728 RepID=UPI00102A17D0|nr:fimbria/pilus outer membrane usher protein [Avibacterium paragallinarum]RZN59022.1 fimbrial biogenesis outer membrane usher protein [Avibacterium paragallinarum]TID11929.1 fimbrial protein [Avibacterium paragallinarum]
MIKPHLQSRFKPSLLSLLLLQSFSFAYAGEYAEFEPLLLYQNQDTQSVDLSRFNYGNPVPAGRYIADVYLNNKLRGRTELQFVQLQGQNNVVLCADSNLLNLLDLKETAFSTKRFEGDCPAFDERVTVAKSHFDFGELRLDVDIPQAFIMQRPRGYISPLQWQQGTPVAFVRYDANYYRYQYGDQHSQQIYLGLNAGVNLLGWSIRHRGSMSWAEQKKAPYQSISTYAQREIAALRGQFIIGDFYTNGVLMDSIAIRGGQLSSDDRMLATSIRGYAPTIRGVANSNAVVKVTQNGTLLREVNVPAGAFEIDDLFPTGYGGDLQVEVLESNGKKQTFSVPYTATAQLLRPGYSRYQLAVGRYRYANHIFKENVAQGSWQYGLNNFITLNLGTTLAKNYHSELIGVALNSAIGAFAANATFSNAYFTQLQQRYRGYNLSFSYNTKFEPTNTNVTLANYRYLSRNYYGLQDVIFSNSPDKSSVRVMTENNSYRPKNHLQLAINQIFNEKWGSAYFSVSRYSYWGSNRKQNEFQFGYGNRFKRLNYNFSISQTQNSLNQRERRFYLSLSMSLGNDSDVYVSQTLNLGENNAMTSHTSLSGTIGEERNYNYGVSFSRTKQEGKETQSISINNSYSTFFARLNGSYSRNNQGGTQVSLGMSGAVVAHPKGITLANDLGDTFAIIHADGARGAKISGSIGNQIDYFGNGIVPYATPYSINHIGLESLPDNVELSATEQQIIPKANQAVLVNFATKVGTVVYFEIQNNESFPPMGTEVFDQENNPVGIVAQGGKIYSRGIPRTGKLNIHWGEKRCIADYQVPKMKDDKPIVVPIQCQFY